jgi:hypothetical protein
MIYGEFSIDPPYFGYNSAKHENPVLCIFMFRVLPELKFTWDFSGVNILSWEPSREQEVNEGGHEGQTRLGGAGPWPGHAPNLVWASSLWCRLSLSPDAQLDMKTPI